MCAYKHNAFVVIKIGAYIHAYFVWVPIILILGICFTCNHVMYCIRYILIRCLFFMGVNYQHLVVLEKNALNSLMVCVVHNLAGPTPTTFLAATDTLS